MGAGVAGATGRTGGPMMLIAVAKAFRTLVSAGLVMLHCIDDGSLMCCVLL